MTERSHHLPPDPLWFRPWTLKVVLFVALRSLLMVFAGLRGVGHDRGAGSPLANAMVFVPCLAWYLAGRAYHGRKAARLVAEQPVLNEATPIESPVHGVVEDASQQAEPAGGEGLGEAG